MSEVYLRVVLLPHVHIWCSIAALISMFAVAGSWTLYVERKIEHAYIPALLTAFLLICSLGTVITPDSDEVKLLYPEYFKPL